MEKRRIQPENPRSYTVCRAQHEGLSVADDVVVVKDIPSLCCSDEEADTRLVWRHVKHMCEDQEGQIIVRSSDTDVFIILLWR